MPTVVVNDILKARRLLREFPSCTCFPKMSGFNLKGNKMEIVFPELKNHPEFMSEVEFVNLIKSIHSCALKNISFGPISKESVRISYGRTVILPNFAATSRIISGRIENPYSFFTTVQTLADSFKSSGGLMDRISRGKMPIILQAMEELSLEVTPTSVFLPSLGVWRHSKLVEKIENVKDQVYIPMRGSESFVSFLSEKGLVFSSIEDVKKEISKGKYWHNIFSNIEELSDVDPSLLALFIPLRDVLYVFNSACSTEMHTVCHGFSKFNPQSKMVEISDPMFVFDAQKEMYPPVISDDELEWFLKTFFGAPAIFEGDKKQLFETTKGELFAISELISHGKWWIEDGIWHIKPAVYRSPNPTFFLRKARQLSKNGEKPNLGLEFVNLARSLAKRNTEAFESLRAFFYKVLGEYDKMDEHFKLAEEFGKRTFRNAYFSVVLAMNNMKFPLLQEKSNELVEIIRKYTLIVSNEGGIEPIYKEVIAPLERSTDQMARRIEIMARNYIGVSFMSTGRNEEAVDELETALSIATEHNFKDLEPLIGVNIGYAISSISPSISYNKTFSALKKSMIEGLDKTTGGAHLILANNLIERGEFEKATLFLKNAEKVSPELKPDIDALRIRMKVENMEFDEVDEVADSYERSKLKFLEALYEDDKKQALEILKTLKIPEFKSLKVIAFSQLAEFGDSNHVNYLASYFLANRNSNRALFFLKLIERQIYKDDANLRKIFYEEQLAKAYTRHGLLKAADHHMNLAALVSKHVGLKRRFEWLSKKINDKSSLKDSYELTKLSLLFREFTSTYETVKMMCKNISKFLGEDVMCQLEGVEKFIIRSDPDGTTWDVLEKVDLDFVWALDRNKFVYPYYIKGGAVYLEFSPSNLSMDDAIFFLDQSVPFYALHLEKSMADKMSNIDSLTGLYSRGYIMNKLIEEVERAERYDESFSVAMVDIDDFKKVNDKNGHDIGDEVLRRISELMVDSVRNIDAVGRYGGEEFLILFPHTPLIQAIKSCERIRRKIEKAKIIPSNLTVSIGVTELKKPMSAEELIKHADIALYLVKGRGKNQVAEYPKTEVKK